VPSELLWHPEYKKIFKIKELYNLLDPFEISKEKYCWDILHAYPTGSCTLIRYSDNAHISKIFSEL
jgi:hypothetical protein